MSGLFQRLASRGPAASGTARLVLAAFGKHPGWNDHIPGIGVETETLAYVKQTLYVGGIGRQIDSGAWEKLEPEKRLEGFDHVFLWQRGAHTLVGELWSSSDRKGRSKYPMVLCVDGENVSADFVLERACPELEKLRGICKAATTAEQVTAECKTAQERLSTTEVSGGPGALASVAARRRFLEHPEAGPEQTGLLRVLHELRIVASNGSGRPGQTGGGAIRLCHLRVPATGSSTADSLALWAAFFQAAVPKGTPLLLICRKTANWLDAVIGEPESDDFFCLGASLSALPLTTQIPYELAPELKTSLEKAVASFLGTDPPKPVADQRAPAVVAAPGETKPPVVIPSQKKRNWLLPFVICVVLGGAGAAGYWLMITNRHSNSVTEAKLPTPSATNSVPAAAPQSKPQAQTPPQATAVQSPADLQYQRALDSAQQAFNQSNYAMAVAQAEAALQVKSNDPAALKIITDVKAQQDVAAFAANQQQQKYESAMKAAQAALDRQDFSGAVAQANAAMAIKPNDAAAAKLKTTAQAMAAAAALEIQRQKKYSVAMSEAQAAFAKGDFSSAAAKAGEALNLRTNDAGAVLLKQKAQAALTQAEQDSRFAKLMSSAQAAEQAGDFSNAITQADAARAIRPGDATATALYQKATQELTNQINARQTDRLDTELEIYLVRFGLLDPRKAKTPEARRETQWQGELSNQQKDQSLNDVKDIQAALQAAGRMDAARGKQLDELKAAINDHL